MSTKAVTAALITRLQAINGAGGYTHDLSGHDRVTQRVYLSPDRVPCLSVRSGPCVEVPGPDLTGYTERATFYLWGIAAATSDLASARIDAAADMLDDIKKALRADRSLGGTVLDSTMSVKGNTFSDQDEASAMELSGVMVEVTVEWWETES